MQMLERKLSLRKHTGRICEHSFVQHLDLNLSEDTVPKHLRLNENDEYMDWIIIPYKEHNFMVGVAWKFENASNNSNRIFKVTSIDLDCEDEISRLKELGDDTAYQSVLHVDFKQYLKHSKVIIKEEIQENITNEVKNTWMNTFKQVKERQMPPIPWDTAI